MRTKCKAETERDAGNGRVFAVWRPGHFGKVLKEGPQVSEVRWEDGYPEPYVSNYYLFDESISPARARVLSRLARIKKGLP